MDFGVSGKSGIDYNCNDEILLETIETKDLTIPRRY